MLTYFDPNAFQVLWDCDFRDRTGRNDVADVNRYAAPWAIGATPGIDGEPVDGLELVRHGRDDPAQVRQQPDGERRPNQTVPAPTAPARSALPVPSTAGAQPVAAATHVYDGERRGMRDARSDVPPVPAPRPARTMTGVQPVAPATHVYEDGDAFGMRLGPPLNRDARSAPPVTSSPRPGRTTDGSAVGNQPGNPNQPPDAARERPSFWEQHCQGRDFVIILITMAFVVMVTLMITVLVHVVLVHTASQPPHYDSPVKNPGGPDTPGGTVWKSSAVLRTVTSAVVIMPVKPPGGPDTPGGTVWQSSAELKAVTSADVIM
ncbi:Hypp9705, partial [Branchiostoma lanceolatum]